MQPVPCSEREKIMERYRAAIRGYSATAGALDQLAGEDLEKAYQRAEQARQAFETAREELQRHMEEHGC
jgi:hypothetical protein